MIFILPIPLLLLLVPLLLMSLTIHEYAHGRTALAFGDHTAKLNGRLTLNPIAHLDPIGTLALLFIGFGWAKPVPVNPYNLHPPKWGNIAVSLAGPMSNLMLAIVMAILLRIAFVTGILHSYEHGSVIQVILTLAITINLVLCVFNLIPLFPLDGHHIVRELLPSDRQAGFMRWQIKFGNLALMGFIFLPILIERFRGTRLPEFFYPIRSILFLADNLINTHILS